MIDAPRPRGREGEAEKRGRRPGPRLTSAAGGIITMITIIIIISSSSSSNSSIIIAALARPCDPSEPGSAPLKY